MKMHEMKLVLALGLSVVGMGAAWAGPLQRSQVAGDAVWFLHLDVDKLKTTEVGKFILGELEKPDAAGKIAAVQAMFNFDPRKNLKGATLYSRGAAPEDAVLLLQGEFDNTRLTSLIKLDSDYQGTLHGSYTIHSWVDKGKKAKGGSGRTFGAIHTNGLVIVGQKGDRIGEALDVLDGTLAKTDSTKLLPALGAAAESCIVVGEALQLDLGKFAPNAEILKHFKGMTLLARETPDTVAVDLTVEAENEDAARNLEAMTKGMLAWVAFQGDKAGKNKILQGLSISQKGSSVAAALKISPANLMEMVKDNSGKRSARQP